MRHLKIALAVLLLVALQSCISLKTWYNMSDYYIDYQLDRYFNVTSTQEDFLDIGIDKLLTWHRREELPKYMVFLEGVKKRVKVGLTVEDLQWFNEEIKRFNANFACFLADDTAEFLSLLSEEQIQHLEEELVAYNEELLEKIEQPESEIREESIKKTIESIEQWLGDLSAMQKKKIEDLYVVSRGRTVAYYKQRLASQKRFVAVLRVGKSTSELRETVLELYLNPQKYYSKEYKKLAEARRVRNDQLILAIDKMATEEQREHMIALLDNYIREIADLHKEN